MSKLKEFSELPRYVLKKYYSQDGWGKSVTGMHLVRADPGDKGEVFMVEDVRNFIQPLLDPYICGSCGKATVGVDVKFCCYCGSKL